MTVPAIDLSGLFPPAPCHVYLATVVAAAPNELAPTGAWLAQLLLQPGNHPAEARVAHLGAGLLQGVFAPVLPGQEVLVLAPEGNLNAAIILGGLHNLAMPAPLSHTGLRMLLQCPTGVHLRSVDGIPADGVVLGNFLAAFQTYTTALATYIAAIKPIADPTNAATLAFGSATAAFLAALATSAGFVDPTTGGVGGAPFASNLVRSTV